MDRGQQGAGDQGHPGDPWECQRQGECGGAGRGSRGAFYVAWSPPSPQNVPWLYCQVLVPPFLQCIAHGGALFPIQVLMSPSQHPFFFSLQHPVSLPPGARATPCFPPSRCKSDTLFPSLQVQERHPVPSLQVQERVVAVVKDMQESKNKEALPVIQAGSVNKEAIPVVEASPGLIAGGEAAGSVLSAGGEAAGLPPSGMAMSPDSDASKAFETNVVGEAVQQDEVGGCG